MRALIAVPHESHRDTFVSYLRSLPFNHQGAAPVIDFVADGIAVMATVQQNIEKDTPYDLVIVDQHLPGARGAQIVHFVRFDKAHCWAPILVFEAEAHPTCVQQMKDAGVKEYLTLPLNLDDFKERLTRMTDLGIWEEEADRSAQLEGFYSKKERLIENDIRDDIYLHSLGRIQRRRQCAPWSVNGQVAEAKVLVGMNRFREALPLLRAVVTRHFNHKEAHRLLNYCYNRLGLRYEELPELKLLLKQKPDSPTLQLQLADALRRSGDHRQAIDRYRLILVSYAKNQTRRYVAQTHVGLGKSLNDEGNQTKNGAMIDEAEKSFRTGEEVDPTYLAAHVNLAILLKETGRQEEANEVIARLRAISPKDPEDWVSLFEYYLRSGDPVKGRAALDHALSMEPDNLKILVDATLLLIRQNMFREAIRIIEQALIVNPSDKTLYNYRGICYRHLGEYDEALASYTAALAIDETDASIHFNKGRVHEARGDKEKAVACYEDALFFDPALPEIDDRMKRLTKELAGKR